MSAVLHLQSGYRIDKAMMNLYGYSELTSLILLYLHISRSQMFRHGSTNVPDQFHCFTKLLRGQYM